MAKQEETGIMEFMKRYDTEEKCREQLYKLRWPDGFKCPKCGRKDSPFNIKARHKYQCRHCGHQASVTAGTVMDKSRTPLTKWFLAIYLMGSDKRGCSAMRLKRELGVAYDTAWTMSHKIRHAMGERDGLYKLLGTVEMDDAFFGGARKGSGRGRGTEKAAVVMGLTVDESGRPGYVKARVCQSVDGDSLLDFAEGAIGKGSTIRCDGYPAYKKLAEKGFVVDAEKFDSESERLKWLHVFISNAKAFIIGTYHGLGREHLQAYLDEFCYRSNRRKWQGQIFCRAVSACAATPPFTRYDLIG